MPDRSGVEIYKRFYPWPDGVRLGDPILVTQITGMKWQEFEAAQHEWSDALEDSRERGEEPPSADPVVFAGMVAMAFWQGNPQMTRDKARRALERIKMDDIELIDGDDVEDDVGPPAQGGEEAAQTTPSRESGSSPEQFTEMNPLDSSSAVTSPNGSGLPGSHITSQELSPT